MKESPLKTLRRIHILNIADFYQIRIAPIIFVPAFSMSAISPSTLGKESDTQVDNLVNLMDGYFTPDGGHHLNVNVFDRDLLVDAMEHPEKYPQLTIRVSGYAVNFVKLTREQQLDVLSRTINQKI